MTFSNFTRFRKSALLVTALASMAVSAHALDYTVNYTTTAPVIDGTVDPIWTTAAAPVTGFVSAGDNTLASTEQSSARLLWDQTKLYVLFEMQDAEIYAAATADDAGFLFSAQDTAEIFLDPSLIQVSSGTNHDRVYHVSVDPSPNAYTWTEAGQNQTAWNLSDDSNVAFTANGTNWNVEMAIAWTDLRSTETLSPGYVQGPPRDGVIWGLQLGRLHGNQTAPANNVAASKWNPSPNGAFRVRPFGLMKFAGGPPPAPLSLAGKTITYTNGFEAPLFTAEATASGIDGWTAAVPTNFNATTEKAKTGSQSLRATPGAGSTLVGSQRSSNLLTPKYLQYAFYLPLDLPGAGYRHVAYVNGEYDNGTGGTQNAVAAQIWFNQNNTTGANVTSIYNFEDPVSETVAQGVLIPGMQAYDTWTYLTVKVNPENTYEVWINDQKMMRPTGEDYYTVSRRSTFRQFTFNQFYNKNFGTLPTYFDDVVYADDLQDSSIQDWQLF